MLSGGAVEVRSAGSEPADEVNPAVREALLEDGIDISAETPKILTTDAVQASDVVVTMGCGDTCPIFPGKRYEDWVLDDPAGQGIDGGAADSRRHQGARPAAAGVFGVRDLAAMARRPARVAGQGPDE